MKPSDPQTAKIKVLFMLPTLCPGGAERILITLMNNLDRERFDPLFLTLNEMGPIREWIAKDIPFYAFKNRTVKNSIFQLRAFIKEHQPDVLFTTMVHMNGLALLMKIFFPHIRVIVREAALPSSILKGYGIKGKLCFLVYKCLYPKADLVISNCSQMVEEFKNKLKIKLNNHQILFNPVDLKPIFAQMPDQLSAPKDRENMAYFVCVGRLSYEKGYDRLIQALANSPPRKNWRLDIIGEGHYRQQLEELIQLYNLQDHVFLCGYRPRPWDIAAQADCLLLPSRWEGMPNVVLEGFSCGIPAIAMREAGGISDISNYTEKNQLRIFDTMDEFVEAMKDVELSPKKTCAPSILPKEFSLPHIMQQFESVLKPQQKQLL